jgi:hypothetical protein
LGQDRIRIVERECDSVVGSCGLLDVHGKIVFKLECRINVAEGRGVDVLGQYEVSGWRKFDLDLNDPKFFEKLDGYLSKVCFV